MIGVLQSVNLGFNVLKIDFRTIWFQHNFVHRNCNKNAKTVVIEPASPLLFDSLEEGGVNRVNGGRGTDLLLDNESSVILSNRLLGNVPRKFSFVQSI